MQRRQFLMGASVLTTAACLGRVGAAQADVFPVVETANGKLRGLNYGGVSVFKGVHYGADTGGANRFLPPQPVKKWRGLRDASGYGNIAPQIPGNRRHVYADLILNDVQPGGMGEDCLVLNVYTPEARAGGKRPVIVRFHGGGFYGGSSNTPGADGWMLAGFGDCVVVTVNHRLSSLGYLYLGDEGEFADSGSVGLQDLVASLEWVRENIEMFGGDPGRVMIFGQSGGGAKVSNLLTMPSAQGLFHSAGVMSGSALTSMTREEAERVSDRLLKQLGLTKKDIKKLQQLPFTTLLNAQAEVEAEERSRGEAPRSFSPVIGDALPRHPFTPDAPPLAKDIPMIVSSVLDERTYRQTNFAMTWDQVKAGLEKRVGKDAEDLLRMYRHEDPKASPFIINARIDTDATFRRSAHVMSDRKAEQGGAPVWKYLWTVPSAAFGGRYGAVHGVDVAYSMYDIRFPLAGPTAENKKLAEQLASAWVSLAATGDPNNKRTAKWPSYDTSKRSTLVFGENTSAVDDPRKEFRAYWAAQAAGDRII
ncbi:carboxylesterase/lipase family protein [Gilvimarinus sp. F26214L]|uniref:carboxylesterase/lipase family protein n=1 Tax=Gilvimarinus sp. DZF01 TaxID=3461371 RepID=UPI004045A2BA